jgi:hypothetical protein
MADWVEERGVVLVDRLQIEHKVCFCHLWVRQSNSSLIVLGPFLVHELQRVDGGFRIGWLGTLSRWGAWMPER